MAGKFIPGQPSSIRGWAWELGTSPNPVREALRRLVTEKAFQIHPNGSVVVPIMTRTRFHDLQRARILIEGFATELAAGLRVAIQNDILETGDFIIYDAIPRFQKLHQKP